MEPENPMINFPHIVLQFDARRNEVECAHGPWKNYNESINWIDGLSDEHFEHTRYTPVPCVPA